MGMNWVIKPTKYRECERQTCGFNHLNTGSSLSIGKPTRVLGIEMASFWQGDLGVYPTQPKHKHTGTKPPEVHEGEALYCGPK